MILVNLELEDGDELCCGNRKTKVSFFITVLLIIYYGVEDKD